MNYELAKKLKDAGFPQDGYPRGDMVVDDIVCEQCNDRHHAYAPTLEELIEACGIEFGSLTLLGEDAKYRWYADNREGVRYYGATPLEAVANLYLALNIKI